MSEIKEKPKSRNLSQRLSGLSSSNNGRLIGRIFLITIILFSLFALIGEYSGLFSIIFPKPEVEKPEYHIGYCTFSVYARNSTGKYNQVDANITFVGYYNESIIRDDVVSDGTMYQTTNVTFGVITNVPNTEGLVYPNKTFLIYANESSSTPTNNTIYINPYGDASEFDVVVFKLNDLGYGDFDITDIVSDAEKNITMSLQLSNNGNGTFGETFYITEPFRYNENVSVHGLWMKVDTEVTYVSLNDNQNYMVYYDDVGGNTYILLPTINAESIVETELYMECDDIPSAIDFINGQFDSAVLDSL